MHQDEKRLDAVITVCGRKPSEGTLVGMAASQGKRIGGYHEQSAKLIFLPKYSHNLNPIEQVFAKLKHLLRKAAARTVETVCAAIGEILAAFTPKECANYFRNSGYPT